MALTEPLEPMGYLAQSNLEAILDQIVVILQFEQQNQLVQGDNLAKAQGTLTLDTLPIDLNTFTVGSKTYTLQATLTDFDGNIQLGVDLSTTQANIIAAFDLSGTAGVDYALSMVANTDVDIAAFVTNNAILTAKNSGTAGNSIATTSSFTAGTNTFDAVTLGTTRAGFAYDSATDDFKVVKELHTRISDEEFDNALVNVYFFTADTDPKNQKTDKRFKPDFNIDIYARRDTDDDDDGLTKAALKVHRTMMQVVRILYDPRYERLGFSYEDPDGNKVQFIEKRSITSMQKFQPEESAESVENIIAIRVILHVEEDEKLKDLTGPSLDTVNSTVAAQSQ